MGYYWLDFKVNLFSIVWFDFRKNKILVFRSSLSFRHLVSFLMDVRSWKSTQHTIIKRPCLKGWFLPNIKAKKGALCKKGPLKAYRVLVCGSLVAFAQIWGEQEKVQTSHQSRHASHQQQTGLQVRFKQCSISTVLYKIVKVQLDGGKAWFSLRLLKTSLYLSFFCHFSTLGITQ